jgi:hypothetical protein
MEALKFIGNDLHADYVFIPTIVFLTNTHNKGKAIILTLSCWDVQTGELVVYLTERIEDKKNYFNLTAEEIFNRLFVTAYPTFMNEMVDNIVTRLKARKTK